MLQRRGLVTTLGVTPLFLVKKPLLKLFISSTLKICKIGMIREVCISAMRRTRFKPDKNLTFYHVMTRTAQQNFLLSGDHDPELKRNVDQIIKSLAQVFYVEIFAHVYMDNHYHLAISVSKPTLDAADVQQRFERLQEMNAYPRKWQPEYLDRAYERFIDLSAFMSEINSRIARTHNRRHGKTGHFWGDRFKSKIIENEAALLRVMTYIEQNPVRAGLCRHPSEYPWCSAGANRKCLAEGKKPRTPKVGPFQHLELNARAKLYIDWMDYHADQILNDGAAISGSKRKLGGLKLKPEELLSWQKDFQSKGPANWSRQGYGSETFEESVASEVKALALAMAARKGDHRRDRPG